MENYEQKEEEPEVEAVEIYSKRAILGFSIFFNVIFGAVLLALNLKAAGYKKPAIVVVVSSILYFIVSSVIVFSISPKNGAIVYIFNIAGGLILSEYFYRKYFPEEDYYPKSIMKPLLISIIIALAYGLAVVYYMKVNGIHF